MTTLLGAILDTLVDELSSGPTTRPRVVRLVKKKGFDDPRLDLIIANELLDLIRRGLVARTMLGGKAYYHLSKPYLAELKAEQEGT